MRPVVRSAGGCHKRSLGAGRSDGHSLWANADLVRLDHTVAIHESLPNAQLAVFPNSTHLVPYDDPQMFNATVERFLTTPIKNKNRIADTVASFEKLMSGLPR